MKILMLSEYFPDSGKAEITGGVESRAFNIAKRLAKSHKVTVLTSWREGLARQSSIEGIKVVRAGPHHEYSNYSGFLSRLEFAWAAIQRGRKIRADIIDAYNWTTYVPANFIGRLTGKPVIATYHETWIGEWVKNKGIITGIPYEIYERMLLLLGYSHFISVSNFTKKRLMRHGIDEKKITVINNGVDIKAFSKYRAKDPSGICFIGRLIKTKNADVLVKAMSVVKKKYPDVVCRIIGKGPEENRLKMLARDLGANIEFMGFIEKHQDVMQALKDSYIFCSPSTLEGFGMVLAEAMALNVPYVCTDMEVFRETTDDGKGGFLFKAGNHRELAMKIDRLLENKKLYNRKKAEQKQLVKKYEWDSIVKDTENVYLSLINEKK